MSLLRKDSKCHGCYKFEAPNKSDSELETNEVSTLKSCKDCLSAKYCSRPCQVTSWPNHQAVCKRIKWLLKTIKDLEEKDQVQEFRNTAKVQTKKNEKSKEPPKNYQDYVTKKVLLAYAYWHIAEQSECYQAYSKFSEFSLDVLQEFCEVVEESKEKTFALKYFTIFAQLAMGKFEAAYNYIQFWLLTYEKAIENEENYHFEKIDELKNLQFEDLYSKHEGVMNIMYTFFPKHVKDWHSFMYEDDNYGIERELIPYLPAIIAIKIKEIDELVKIRQDQENFAKALKSDEGTLKEFQSRFPWITQKIQTFVKDSRPENELTSEYLETQKNELAILFTMSRTWAFENHSDVIFDHADKYHHGTDLTERKFLKDDVLEYRFGYEGFDCAEGYFQRLMENEDLQKLIETIYKKWHIGNCCYYNYLEMYQGDTKMFDHMQEKPGWKERMRKGQKP